MSILRVYALALALVAAGCASSGGDGDGDMTDPDATDISDQSDTINPPGGNQAPELSRIGNRRAPIDKTLSIEVQADDPDGDVLTYSVFGDLPEGSKFQKATRTFEWTPTAADDGRLVILTFAVSDGEDEDRETIQITVTTSDESTRPQLAEIGDVFLEVNEPYELRLQGTDEDGDTLTYSTVGPLPSGATLDSKTGVLTWTPDESQQGTAFRVTFSVTDGEFTTEAEARFLVQTAELKIGNIPPQEVALNETLELVLPIENPLDFKFDCTTVGELPDGASFDTDSCTLSYTPADPALVDTSKEFTFRVTGVGNGVDYNLLKAATVFIVEPGGGGDCTPDMFEPNDTDLEAETITAGNYPNLSICGDEDWYAVEVGAGETLTATLTFDHKPNGDLDVYIYPEVGDEPLAVGDSTTDNETAILPDATAGTYYINVFEFADGSNDYELGIEISGDSCTDDSREPNDTLSGATQLGAGDHFIGDGYICPGNDDYLAFDGTASDQVNITLAFDNSVGDLDMELYDPSDNLLAWSRLTIDEETISLAALPSSGTYTVRIFGYQNASADYLLEIEQDTGVMCTGDSYEGNDTPMDAGQLPGGDTTVSNLTFCGDNDYYVLSVGANETVVVDMNWTGTNSADLTLYDPQAIVALASGTPQMGGGGLTLERVGDGTPRDHILEVTNATLGLDYSFEIIRVGGSMCDATSCPAGEVCGDNGSCISDSCSMDSDCPSAYRCRQDHCVDACFANSDCREAEGYSCRGLSLSDSIAFCAESGSNNSGDGCTDFSDCNAESACLTGSQFPAGYCAELGCSSDADCDFDSTCVDVNGTPACLYYCFVDSDCRMADGYSCQSLPAVGSAGNIDVCIN